MNLLDIIILAVLAVCVYSGYRRGLIRTVFSLASFFIAIILASQLYPYVSHWLRGTFLYDSMKRAVINSMGLRTMFEANTARTQAELIASLPLPGILREMLANYNTADIYELLNVQTIEDYIGGYFANIALNVIAILAVFILVWVLMRVIGGALDIIGKLPVIHSFNRAGGLAAGLITGLLFVWLGLTLLNLFFVNASDPKVLILLNESLIADWLYENNWFMNMITRV